MPAIEAATKEPRTKSRDTGAKPRKWKMILSALAQGRRLTRFDAEHLGCHCLNTTIAGLEARGVRILREQVVVGGRFDPIHCKRYQIDLESIELARQLLGGAT